MTLPDTVINELMKKFSPETASILQKMQDMEERLNEKIEAIAQNKYQYSSVASKSLENKFNTTNQLLKSIAKSNEPQLTDEEKKIKNGRTLIVRQYKDPNIRNSHSIKTVINQHFKGEPIRDTRTTAGGSILIELEDEAAANRIKSNWNKKLFGGNAGVVIKREDPPAGLIKGVYVEEDIEEEEIIAELKSSYPDSDITLFKRNGKFTGTIKIGFQNHEELEQALENRPKIFDQRYIMEKYKNQPRVIICHYCQTPGHVERICRKKALKKHVCGKCASLEHETKDCVVEEKDYKCFHCEGKHQCGHKKCPFIQQKLEEISARMNNGS